jgi:subtilase family serine protease
MKKAVLAVLILLSTLSFVPNVSATSHTNACSARGGSSFRCHAHIVTDENGSPHVTSSPDGFGPANFLKAYSLRKTAPVKTTIAIIDAYDDPNIYNDLAIYSQTFGLPALKDCAISTATKTKPCFQKIDQNGGTNYPVSDAGWASEIALDVEIAHGICQNCSILLVEAKSASFNDLMTAFDKAVSMGANVISNSYGGGEFSGETGYDSHFNRSGIAITFSSGDSGYGVEYPAASKYVTAVGGTSLSLKSTGTYLSETAWSGAGSGCSKYESKPVFQKDAHCSNRTVADVSADADPDTGAAIYDSFSFEGKKGWFKIGGTSLASPLVAGVYAVAGLVPTTKLGNSLPYTFAKTTSLHDIALGKNGTCKGTYLCDALEGYDGPTGLGSPKGEKAF